MSLRRRHLADPALNERLTRFVAARLGPDDVHDVVQSTLTEALAAKNAPETEEELTKWLFGIARNEIADHFRKRRREVPADPDDVDVADQPPSDGSAKGLLRWAKGELPPGSENEKTLEWMLREGEGEKLEHIAEESAVPAARVRKRVSRLREHFRVRYAAAIGLGLVIVAIVIAILALRNKDEDRVAPVPSSEKAPPRPTVPSPEDRAKELRELAFDACDRKAWQQCLDRLDEAKALDPAHDADERVQNARKSAADALAPPVPIPSASSAPPAPTVRPTAVPTATSTMPVPSGRTGLTGSGSL